MQPSEIRSRVLADHGVLRRELVELERFAGDVDAGQEARAVPLRSAAEQLLDRLERHMQWEEAYLLPALREADAWGRERAVRFEREHREQRELLAYIIERLHDAARPPAVVARDVHALIDLLRDDMQQEESEFLDDRVLRDDVVGIDVETQ